MTIEEALTEIQERVHVTEYVGSSYVDCVDIEALRVAIEALEQPEIIHCRDCEKYGTKFCAMDIWTDQVTIRRAKPNDFCSKAERREDG